MSTRSRLLTALAAVAFIAGCGDNFWAGLPTGSGGRGGPEVEILDPAADSRVALQDSVLVRVRISDRTEIASLELSGFSVRGSEALGTSRTVARYETKQLTLGEVADTVVSRFLVATADSLSEDSVYVVARATNAAGLSSADTVVIAIGGPRVQIVTPEHESSVRAGTSLSVAVHASDASGRIQTVRVVATGSLTADTVLAIDPSRSQVDTTVAFEVPIDASGEATLSASVLTTSNETASSGQIVINVVPPIQDSESPTLSYAVAAPTRAEHDDSLTVQVTATDSTEVSEVGITVVPVHSLSTTPVTLPAVRRTAVGREGTFTFALDELGLPVPTDSSTVRIEITAFATDTAGNCATATAEGTPLSESCQSLDGHTYGPRGGARWEILMLRGLTVSLGSSGDRIADLASNGTHVFLSNITQNRVEVLPVGSLELLDNGVSVGSRPWGLAFDQANEFLYVANSGGTNISVVSPVTLQEVDRLQTPNMKLFDVTFQAGAGDGAPSSVTRHDYSDRPQHLGVTQNQNIIYSTLPTSAARDGTVRIYRTAQRRLEIVTDYVENRPDGKLLVLNADSAFLVLSTPSNLLRVCPRARSADPAIDGSLPEVCYTGSIGAVRDTIAALGYDTEFHYNKDVAEVGLTDTTYVAVSGDHSTVAFGEGAIDHARVMVLVDSAGAGPTDPLYKHGEISDLIGNAAERVIGLALNDDGSLGVARGEEAYYFSRDLRLQGVVGTGAQAGGVDMHPQNAANSRSFVSGIQEDGLAYIDVVDSFHFRRISRIFMRDPVTGPIRAVETAGGLTIYAVTDEGIVVVEVLTDDL